MGLEGGETLNPLKIGPVLASFLTTLPVQGKADTILLNAFPVCVSSAAVVPAQLAHIYNNIREVIRLGCLVETPSGLRLRALRCEPSGLKSRIHPFTYPVRVDSSLPAQVCEIEAWLAGSWKGILYTNAVNIKQTEAWQIE